MYFLLFFLLVLVSTNGEDICTKCSCSRTDDAQTLDMNCANRNLHHVWGEWPSYNSLIKVTYAGNDIVTLEALPATDAVVEIVLSECNIRYLRTGLFSATVNVKLVDLSHNVLPAEEIASDRFEGPYNDTVIKSIALEHLNLAYNQIHSLGKNVFEHMPNLKILNLEGNDFTVLDIHTQLALSAIRQLQSLNLANNELTEMIVGAIDSHENLTELNLSRNLLDFVPKSLAHIGKSLEILNLDDNPIIELVSQSFLGVENMIELSLNNLTNLKYINASAFASMPKLRKLSLSNNPKLKDIDKGAFGVNQTLEELYLNNNDLYRLDSHLLQWSKLHTFEFVNNPFQCSCDLYNISSALSSDITQTENSPMCKDPRNNKYISVFDLKILICLWEHQHKLDEAYIEYHYSMVKITLIILSVIAMVMAISAVGLALVRYRRNQRSLRSGAQILYNPVSTESLHF